MIYRETYVLSTKKWLSVPEPKMMEIYEQTNRNERGSI